MSRTDLPAETLARSLRARAGDGSSEWTYEPIQTSVLLDIADLLDENAKLRELVVMLWTYIQRPVGPEWNLKECIAILDDAFDRICELGIEVDG